MAICSAGALAEPAISEEQTITTIQAMPDSGTVVVSGTVEKISNEREFTLRDNSGTVRVKIDDEESVVLKQGDSVTVSGMVEKPLWGLLGKDINATNVQVYKDLPTALSDAVTKVTGLSLSKAEVVQISKLPKKGMVQVTGTVDKISDPKNFILKDATGAINVNIQSEENVLLTKDAEVTVTGYVNNGVLGKKLRATHVILVSNAPADTGHLNAAVQ